MVGNAVATIVESSAAKSITSNSPPKTTSTLSSEVRDVRSAGAATCIAIEIRVSLCTAYASYHSCQNLHAFDRPVPNHNNLSNLVETNRYRRVLTDRSEDQFSGSSPCNSFNEWGAELWTLKHRSTFNCCRSTKRRKFHKDGM